MLNDLHQLALTELFTVWVYKHILHSHVVVYLTDTHWHIVVWFVYQHHLSMYLCVSCESLLILSTSNPIYLCKGSFIQHSTSTITTRWIRLVCLSQDPSRWFFGEKSPSAPMRCEKKEDEMPVLCSAHSGNILQHFPCRPSKSVSDLPLIYHVMKGFNLSHQYWLVGLRTRLS